jgi:hypothetical protein
MVPVIRTYLKAGNASNEFYTTVSPLLLLFCSCFLLALFLAVKAFA